MLTDLSFLEKGQPWLPKDEDTRERFTRYQKNKLIFDGKHEEIYQEQWKRIERVIGNFQDVISYKTIINYQKLVSVKIADLLLGEQPLINSEDNKETIEAIIDNNDLFNKLYENAIDISRFGDALGYIYQDKDGGKFSVTNPQIWIPIVDVMNNKVIKLHVICWKYEIVEGKNKYNRLFVQIHDKGSVEERLYELSDDHLHGIVIGDLLESTVKTTGLSDFAIVHMTNIVTSDRFTGIDDYQDIDSIISEILVRVAQISRILDKHASPSVSGPSSALEKDSASGQWNLKMGNYFPRDSRDDPEVNYITWDGQLEASFKQLEFLTNQLYMISEMGSILLGGEDKGGGQTSGRALRMKMISPLAKTKRIAMRLTPAIKKTIKLLSELGGKDIVNLADDKISITWMDGLPDDELEEAEIIEKRKNSGTISTKSALMKYDQMSEEEAEEEVENIQDEEAQFNPLSEKPFSGDNMVKDDVDGNS